MREARDRKSPVWGLPTGFQKYDELTGGLHEGEMTVFGARPSVGKSSLISQMTVNSAIHIYEQSLDAGEPIGQVIYFSPEMTPEDLVLRQVSQVTEIALTKLRSGKTNEQEAELAEDAARSLITLGSVLKLEAGASVDISEIVEYVTMQNRMGPKVCLVSIDYLTRIDAGIGDGREYTAASKISRELKNLALTQRTPVIVGAQLSRKGARQGNDEDPRSRYPQVTDLRDSGRIEEDADVIGLIHRENELRDSAGPTMQEAVLIVAKNRNGPTGIVSLYFEPHLTRFSDIPTPEEEPHGDFFED